MTPGPGTGAHGGPAPARQPVLRVLQPPWAVRGFLFGLRQPCLLIELQVQGAPDPGRLAAAGSAWLQALSAAGGVTPSRSAPDGPAEAVDRVLLETLLRWLHQLQVTVGLSVVDRGRLMAAGPAAGRRYRVALPAAPSAFHATDQAWRWLLKLADAACEGTDPGPVLATLPALLERLQRATPEDTNTAHFQRAARALDMPCAELAGGVVQYGQGARAHWLNSSFTEHSPQLGAMLARNKHFTATLLRRLGLPCPDHSLVASADDAVRVAERLGYPVVVKPADRDGGVAVSAGLRSASAVRSAHAQAAAYSQRVLVERHVEGRDYRLLVFEGELIWAYERRPGGVVGDGQASVKALVDGLNADPRRGDGPHAPLKRLVLDAEAQALLQAEGLDEASVPAAGCFVRLRRAANITVGGTPVPVLDRVHPDNRLLAVRAAAALRLDLAGIDLLIPDIARSWREVGGWLCEVNGQPTLARPGHEHLFPLILRRLVPGNGRIPIGLFIGDPADGGLMAATAALLREGGLRCGLADGSGVHIDGQQLLDQATAFAAGQMLTTERQVDAVLLRLADDSVLSQGLPFDRFDVLVAAAPPGALPVGLKRQVHAALPACAGPMLGLGEAGRALLTGAGARPVERLDTHAGTESAARRVAELLLQADVLHRSA